MDYDFSNRTFLDKSVWLPSTRLCGISGRAEAHQKKGFFRLFTFEPRKGNTASLTTADSFSLTTIKRIVTLIRFSSSAPGGGKYWSGRPNFILKGKKWHFVVLPIFNFGDKTLRLKIYVRRSGKLAFAREVYGVPADEWIRIELEVSRNSVVCVFKNADGGKLENSEATISYDPLDKFNVQYWVGCDGCWPPAKLDIKSLEVRTGKNKDKN